MSREEHEEEMRKQKSDDIKLQMALDESRKQQTDEEVGTVHIFCPRFWFCDRNFLGTSETSLRSS